MDALVRGLLDQRAQARAAKDFAAADAIRDQIKAAGIEVEDTPDGPKWSLHQWPVTPSARARSRRRGKGNPTAGSGGRVKRGLEGRGPTPKAKDREYHQAHKAAKRAEKNRSQSKGGSQKRRGSSDAEWIAGRNSVLEALREGVPVNGVYVAEGAERDGRLREVFALAADKGISLLEVGRGELDRLTQGAVHQGLAARIPSYEYADPHDLIERAEEMGEPAADRDARLGHRPAQPRRDRAQRGRLRRPRRGHPRAPRRRHDRLGLEDQRRRRRPHPGRADGQPEPPDQGVPGRGLHGRRPGRRRRRRACPTSTWPTARWCVVVGSEGNGLSRLVSENCDQLVSIPMANQLESLNAGVAASVTLYAIARARA